jgi:hypothetical protein
VPNRRILTIDARLSIKYPCVDRSNDESQVEPEALARPGRSLRVAVLARLTPVPPPPILDIATLAELFLATDPTP